MEFFTPDGESVEVFRPDGESVEVFRPDGVSAEVFTPNGDRWEGKTEKRECSEKHSALRTGPCSSKV